jgi:hypothetical protein
MLLLLLRFRALFCRRSCNLSLFSAENRISLSSDMEVIAFDLHFDWSVVIWSDGSVLTVPASRVAIISPFDFSFRKSLSSFLVEELLWNPPLLSNSELLCSNFRFVLLILTTSSCARLLVADYRYIGDNDFTRVLRGLSTLP